MGKTLMARAIAASCHMKFRRLQCTPDLMPTDVTGFFTYDKRGGEFTFRPGPVMTNILLVTRSTGPCREPSPACWSRWRNGRRRWTDRPSPCHPPSW